MIHQDDLSSLKIDRAPLPGRPRSSGGFLSKAVFAVIFMGLGAGGMWVFLSKRAVPQKETPSSVNTMNGAQSGSPSLSPVSLTRATLTASGYIVSRQKTVLSSKVSGRITAIHVREGDMVKANQLLVEIDDRELQAQLKLERANLKKAQIDFDRGKKVFESGLISPAEYDHLQVSLDQGKNRVELLETQVSETRIHAPFDGAILQKNQEAGEMTSGYGNGNNSSSEGILTLADLTRMEAEVDIEEKYRSQIEIGQPVEVVAIEAYPDKKFEGRVDRIVPQADRAKRTIQVIITIVNPGAILVPDMNAKVTFLEKAKDKAKEDKK